MSYSHTPDQTKNEPVLVAMSILAALQFFFAGATGVSLFTGSDLVAGIMAAGSLATAAAQTGIQFYVRGQVTPMSDVAELVKDGKVIAGPANDILPSGATVREVGEPPVQAESDEVYAPRHAAVYGNKNRGAYPPEDGPERLPGM